MPSGTVKRTELNAVTKNTEAFNAENAHISRNMKKRPPRSPSWKARSKPCRRPCSKEAAQTATQEVTDLLSWADTFDEVNAETKHMIIARLVERIEINHDYEVEIKFRISVEQYMRIAA